MVYVIIMGKDNYCSVSMMEVTKHRYLVILYKVNPPIDSIEPINR